MAKLNEKQAKIALLKVLEKPLNCIGFKMFWNTKTPGDLIEIAHISKLISNWASDSEGLQFEGEAKIALEHIKDHPAHADCAQVQFKWDKGVLVDIPQAMGRLRYIVNHNKSFARYYSGCEFSVRDRNTADIMQPFEKETA
jgi:hypothetical protein